MIRLCCDDYAWPSVSHRTALSIIADLGFSGVDLGVFGDATHVTVPSVVADPVGRAAAVKGDADAVGLAVSDVFLTASLDLGRVTPTSRAPGDQEQLHEVFAAMVAFATEAAAPGITLLPGVVDDGRTVTDAIAAAADGLAPLVAMGAAAGLGVSVEPHVGSCIETPEATAQLLARCDGLTITLDPSHYVYAGWTVPSMLPLLARTRHVQIRPAADGLMQVRAADNGFDLPLLVGSLVAAGYDGWIASEYVWMEKWRCNEVDNTGESGRLREILAGTARRRGGRGLRWATGSASGSSGPGSGPRSRTSRRCWLAATRWSWWGSAARGTPNCGPSPTSSVSRWRARTTATCSPQASICAWSRVRWRSITSTRSPRSKPAPMC